VIARSSRMAAPAATSPSPELHKRLVGMFTPAERAAGAKPQPHADGDKLFKAAAKTQGDFEALVHEGVGGRLDAVKSTISGKPAFAATKRRVGQRIETPHTIVAAMKDRKAADVKVRGKYKGDYSRLGDIVRGTVLVPHAGDLPSAMEAVRAEAKRRGWKVRNVENRYAHVPGDHVNTGPLPNGYRDVSMHLEHPNGVIAELQLNTTHLWMAKDGANVERTGHRIYEDERAINLRASEAGRDLTPGEKRRMAALQTEARRLYDPAVARSVRARRRS
jgi:hypothetical protein